MLSLSGHLGRLDKYIAFMCLTAVDVLIITHPGCRTSEAESQLWSSLVAKAHMAASFEANFKNSDWEVEKGIGGSLGIGTRSWEKEFFFDGGREVLTGY